MSLELNVLWVIVLLLPGLAGLKYYTDKGNGVITKGSLTSNSLTVLTVVPIISIIAHLVLSALFMINDLVADHKSLLTVSFEPNPYATLIQFNGDGVDQPFSIWWAVMWMILLPWIVRYVGDYYKRQQFEREKKSSERDTIKKEEEYLSYLCRIQSYEDSRSLIGFVVTSSNAGVQTGYSGVVKSVKIDELGRVSSVTLQGPHSFSGSLSDIAQLQERPLIQSRREPCLEIDSDSFEYSVFSVLELPETEPV